MFKNVGFKIKISKLMEFGVISNQISVFIGVFYLDKEQICVSKCIF